jgi:glycosyltransferase involved in cell wall biosynthesis
MRLAILGAFPFPAPQGSQCYAADQARALQEIGVELVFFSYGRGIGRLPEGLPLERIPERLSPRRLRSGFDARKPAADRALLQQLLASHRRRPFAVVLAHNAEAAGVALLARARGGPAVLYVAHTLWQEELREYLPPGLGRLATGIGALLDRQLARRADAVLTLAERGRASLEPHARGPVACIPPGFRPLPAPDERSVREAASRQGLEPGRYALYTGNLDPYQDVPDLDAAAALLSGPEQVVVATHDPRGPALRHVRLCVVRDPDEMRLLVYGARVAVAPRRRAGGFPIKLLQYMEAARPIVARLAAAGTLQNGHSALLLADSAGPRDLATAISRAWHDTPFAQHLAAGARQTLEHHHAPTPLAHQTLTLATQAQKGGSRKGRFLENSSNGGTLV